MGADRRAQADNGVENRALLLSREYGIARPSGVCGR
jgi:hypothetical protein